MGKLLLISFEEYEDDVLDSILFALQKKNIHLQIIENDLQKKMSYRLIEIAACYRKIICDDKEVELTSIEFEILYLLASSPGMWK